MDEEANISQPQEIKSRALKLNTALDDRPREKAMKYGFSTLSPAELFAIILGSGSRGESVVELCQRILNDHGNKIYKIARHKYSDLARMYRGVGEVKAVEILAAIEIICDGVFFRLDRCIEGDTTHK